jgi:predicted nucleic acid-binding protein
MVYFDTNVLIDAFSKNIDDERQKDISVKLVGDAIEDESLIVSELILCEFAFISHKLDE